LWIKSIKSAKNETEIFDIFQHILNKYKKGYIMPKPRTASGEKNLISKRLIDLRKRDGLSQRLLAYRLQLAGYDIDKNVITRIETNKRYVTDLELKAFAEVFHVSYDYLIDGKGDGTETEILSGP